MTEDLDAALTHSAALAAYRAKLTARLEAGWRPARAAGLEAVLLERVDVAGPLSAVLHAADRDRADVLAWVREFAEPPPGVDNHAFGWATALLPESLRQTSLTPWAAT